MTERKDPEEAPGRALIVALSAMAGVAVVVGLVVGGAMVSVAQVGGIGGGEADREAAAPATLYMPSYVPTKNGGDGLDLPGPADTPEALPGEDGPAEQARRKAITLFVAPQNVGPGERINFNGVYPAGEGSQLQIQRKDGGSWGDFPVTATVRGGSFDTWIQTSRTGRAKFRVVDQGSARVSNVVTVTIG